jgi:NAD-dependent dihydropyrimidine dehydrogenase PreA subunit
VGSGVVADEPPGRHEKSLKNTFARAKTARSRKQRDFDVFNFDEKTKKLVLPNENECIVCRQCLELCTTGAISLEGALQFKPKQVSPHARKERVLGYYPYYEVI